MKQPIAFSLNGKAVTLDTDAERRLLWVLRTDLGLTGTKYGCGEGICGACTVIVDGRAVRACTAPLRSVAGHAVTTIEGLAGDGRLQPLQQAFIDHGAFQCGYCTPGMLLAATVLLKQSPMVDRAAAAAALESHLCRCGAHQRILDAIESVAQGTGSGHGS